MDARMIFTSKLHPGAVLNIHGVVLFQGVSVGPDFRSKVVAEAKGAGWVLKPSGDRDGGQVWIPPDAPDTGKGLE
jgi:hypothetical protein